MADVKGKLLACAALMAVATAMVPVGAFAQATGSDAKIAISIPREDMSDALRRLAERSGLQLVYDTKITDGLTTAGVSGTMTVREALAGLLTGSGLTYQFAGDGSVVITTAAGGSAVAGASADGVRAVGVVSVEGAGGTMLFGEMVSAINGTNGSRDVQATEGTGSYTTGAASIVSKLPQTLRETPQSVSILTSQQLEDQSITSVRGVFDKITGITVTDGGNDQEFNIRSRGFAVTTFTFDGGAPVSFAYNNRPILDLSQYDSVQLLRGANGTFGGYNDPGGTVNLVRKKPLDHNQFTFEQDGGSWNNFRSELDVTGPITADGKLRARAIVSRVDRQFFYDIAEGHKSSFYGIMEYDLTPATLVTVGASHVRENNVPNQGGLPRYQDGTEIDFPIATCLCVPWAYERPRRTEFFGTVEQQIGKSISAKFNAGYSYQNVKALYYNSTSSVAKGLFASGNFGGNQQDNPVRQLSLDFFTTGNFSVLNRKVEVVVGGSYQNIDNDGGEVTFYGSFPVPDIFKFNPFAYTQPPKPDPYFIGIENGARQYGGYASVKVEVLKNLHVSSAWRYSHFTDYGLFKYAFDDQPQRLPPATDSNLSRPNIGVTFDFLKNFTLYGSYQSTYRPQENTRFTEGVTSPPPITGTNKEAGLKWQSPSGRLNASLAVYDITQNNFLGTDFSQPGKNVKILKDFISRGADFEVAGEIAKGWQVSLGYSYNDNEERTEFFKRPASSHTPRHILKSWTAYRAGEGSALRGLILGGGVNYQSDYYQQGSLCVDPPTLDQNAPCTGGFASYDFTIKSYATVALKAGYQLNRNIEVSVSSENVTNKRTYTANPGTSVTGYNSYLTPRSVTGSFRLRY